MIGEFELFQKIMENKSYEHYNFEELKGFSKYLYSKRYNKTYLDAYYLVKGVIKKKYPEKHE